LGYGKMVKWVICKIHIDRKFKMLRNEKLPIKANPAKVAIFDFPIFHHSIIPFARQKIRPRIFLLFLISCIISEM
jgi:hypothetical protein